MKCASPDVSCS